MKPSYFLMKLKHSLRKGSTAREWAESIIIAFVLAMFIRTFFIQAFKIPSGSMKPTLIERDRLMVNKIRYGPKVPFTKSARFPGLRQPKRGDIIVFVYPTDPSRDFIKRLVALEGETVEIKEGDLYINDQLIEDPLIKNIFYYHGVRYAKAGEKITVPEDHVFVLGDNSASSSDGRVWGFVPEGNIIGRAEMIYWPFARMRFIK